MNEPNATRATATSFQVELVWNREFDFVPHSEPFNDIKSAIKYARAMENMGDGACVKKTRIVDENGNMVWAYGKMVTAER